MSVKHCQEEVITGNVLYLHGSIDAGCVESELERHGITYPVSKESGHSYNIVFTDTLFGSGSTFASALAVLKNRGIKAVMSTSFGTEFSRLARDSHMVLCVNLEASHHYLVAQNLNRKISIEIQHRRVCIGSRAAAGLCVPFTVPDPPPPYKHHR